MKECSIEGCVDRPVGRGWCNKHYRRWVRSGKTELRVPSESCRVNDCTSRPRSAHQDICEKHYYRLRRNGTLQLSNPAREETFIHCAQCNELLTMPYAFKFCGQRCMTRNIRGREERSAPCLMCHNKIPPSDRLDKKFCSTSCSSSYRYYFVPGVKEQRTVSSAKRRAQKMQAESPLKYSEWKEIVSKCNNRCLCCGIEGVTMDHVVPLSRGGSHSIDNVQPLCLKCNLKKYTKTIDYRQGTEYP